jgi:hypothetical protein
MPNPRVYIPSRSRWDNVKKLVTAWDEEMFDVLFMVEPDEQDKYDTELVKCGATGFARTIALPDRNLGVGFSRAQCIRHAANDDFDAIICSDDDIKPKSGMDRLVWLAEDPLVLGATAYYSYLDLMLGIKGTNREDVIIAPNCIVRLFSLNVQNSLEIGNFDEELKCGDDADFVIRGIMAGYPWFIHLGAKSISFAPRFAEGGVKALEQAISKGEVDGAKGDATRDAVEKIAAKFDGYASARTPTKLAYKWRDIHDDFVPDWKHWSPLHGGKIQNYFGDGWTAP